jgi:hypothetical protein
MRCAGIQNAKTQARQSITYGVACVMNESVSEIRPAEIYSDLSKDEIEAMMAEVAEVDALFQSGRISTMYLDHAFALAPVVADVRSAVPAEAA